MMRFFSLLVFALASSVISTLPVSANPEARIRGDAVQVSYPVPGNGIHVVANDNGGSVVGYAQAVARLRGQDTLVVFNGRCASACTLFLALEDHRTCVAPGASFLFHGAHGANHDMNEWGTRFMMGQYPEWVRTWIARNGGLTSRVIRMDYAYASQFMRTCRVTST
ncbi:hypothetical protein [Roseicyclus sp.]|uniref:hypothetical protein n=1 Tax=Roseicyclus sp. TaxID=1914329 RepID=UPI003F9EDF5F